jgi:hypothetical protein
MKRFMEELEATRNTVTRDFEYLRDTLGAPLEYVQPGMITSRLAPLKDKIRQLLGESGHDAESISKRIYIQPIQARMAAHRIFDQPLPANN